MINEIVISFEGEYVKAISNGEKNAEFASRLWSEIVQACEQNDCFSVLGVATTTGPLDTVEAYAHPQLFRKLGITNKYRIAWVELNPDAVGASRFAETVLKNRGLPGRLFTDLSQAKAWLLGASDA